MKGRIMAEYAEISFKVPVAHVSRIREIVEKVLSLVDPAADFEADRLYSIEEVFPEGIQPHDVLRGLRYRESLTQVQLANLIGVKPSHISEMEHGKRPIGKDMAKRLARALNVGYKVFL